MLLQFYSGGLVCAYVISDHSCRFCVTNDVLIQRLLPTIAVYN